MQNIRGASEGSDGERRFRNVLISWGAWTVFGVLQALTWVLSPVGGSAPDLLRLFGISLFNAYIWALLTPAIFVLSRRLCRADRSRPVWIVISIGVGLVTASIVAILVSSFHGGLPQWSDVLTAQSFRKSSWALSRWFYEEVMLFFLVLGAGIAMELFREYQARQREALHLREQAAHLETERVELNARLAEARLALLRTQLNPHFLFNTLNAVSALVSTDPAGVRTMIALLSDLLRDALTNNDEEEIAVSNETEMLRLYLEILEIRYQGQLRTELVMDDDVRDALVPRMILQPLVENAMKHGVAPSGDDGFISIRVRRDGDNLLLSVRDSGVGTPIVALSDGMGVGLRLTRERLHGLYGADQALELLASERGGTTAQIRLPYHTRAELRQAVEERR